MDIIFDNLPYLPKLGEEVWAEGILNTAGGAANAVIALSRLEKNACLLSPIGNDFWSAFLLQKLREEGVNTQYLYSFDRPYVNITVVMNTKGDRTFVSYGDTSGLDELFEYRYRLLDSLSAKILHVNSSPENRLLPLLESSKSKNKDQIISMDTGWNPEWLTSDHFMKQLDYVDIFCPNELEAMKIAGSSTVEAALDFLSEKVRCPIIKLGEKGAVCKVEGQMYRSSAPVVRAVDATGAGDCFMAGFIYGLLEEKGIEDCLTIANLCGSRCVSKKGGYAGMPTIAELNDLLANWPHIVGN